MLTPNSIIELMKEIWAIEVKHGIAPKIKPGFYQACEDIGVTHRYIVYSGSDEFEIGNKTTVISLIKLIKKLKNCIEDIKEEGILW